MHLSTTVQLNTKANTCTRACIRTCTHTHCFNGHFQGKPELADPPRFSICIDPYPKYLHRRGKTLIPILSIFTGEAKH